MKRTPAKRSSLFLLELIIAILFFSLTSAVCVQFFARAHQISRQTQELNYTLQIRIQPSGRLLHGCFTASRLKSSTPDENPVIYSTETDYCPVPGKGGA